MAAQGMTITYTAWDTGNHVGKTGDASNHSIRLIRDGVEAAATNTPTESGSSTSPGEYDLVLTATEATCNFVKLAGKSSTANVVIIPLAIAFPGLLLGNSAVPMTGNVAGSLFDAINAARAQGFGQWIQNGTSLTLYGPDGTTAVRIFTLNSATAPTQRI